MANVKSCANISDHVASPLLFAKRSPVRVYCNRDVCSEEGRGRGREEGEGEERREKGEKGGGRGREEGEGEGKG